MHPVIAILAIIFSYLIGGINSAYYIGRLWGVGDIRNYGSGNAGTTNVLRTVGKSAALITLIFDISKGMAAVAIGLYFVKDVNIALLCGLAVIMGHNYPVQLGFKGGKGIATSIGVILLLNPLIGLYAIMIGIIIIAITKYVSLGSILGATSYPIIIMVSKGSWQNILFAIAIAVLAVYRHRSNIQRLLSGKESKLKL